MLLAFASHKGSPGVTTAALTATRIAAAKGWDVVLVEADSDGGSIVHLAPNLNPDRNLLSYAIEARREASAATLRNHAQPLEAGGNTHVLIAPPTGRQVANAIDMVAPALMEAAKHPERLVIVDCGRIGGPSAKLFAAADQPYLLVQSRHDLVLGLKDYLGGITREHNTRVLLVGDSPYGPSDLAGIGLMCGGVIADDPKAADVVRGTAEMSAKKFQKSGLVTSMAEFVPDPPTAADHAPNKGMTLSIGGSGLSAVEDSTDDAPAPDTAPADLPAPTPEMATVPAAPAPTAPAPDAFARAAGDAPTADTPPSPTQRADLPPPPAATPAPDGDSSALFSANQPRRRRRSQGSGA